MYFGPDVTFKVDRVLNIGTDMTFAVVLNIGHGVTFAVVLNIDANMTFKVDRVVNIGPDITFAVVLNIGSDPGLKNEIFAHEMIST